MIVIERDEKNIITVRASGTVSSADYDAALPKLMHAIELADDRRRFLIHLEDFSAWELEKLWKQLKFDVTLDADLDRIAIVGHTAIQEMKTKVSSLLVGQDVNFYSSEQEDVARSWLEL